MSGWSSARCQHLFRCWALRPPPATVGAPPLTSSSYDRASSPWRYAGVLPIEHEPAPLAPTRPGPPRPGRRPAWVGARWLPVAAGPKHPLAPTPAANAAHSRHTPHRPRDLRIRDAERAGNRTGRLVSHTESLHLHGHHIHRTYEKISRRACMRPRYGQPCIAYFGRTLALQRSILSLRPMLAYHFTGTFILNSFSAFRNAIFSLSSRGKSTPRNQSVCSFMSANG